MSMLPKGIQDGFILVLKLYCLACDGLLPKSLLFLMELICHNKRHALFSSDSQTFLYELPLFVLKGTL